tara:strand:+ start:1460 stop:1687 length:228 start_codon:yes stop_codon:yes gene_type:complete
MKLIILFLFILSLNGCTYFAFKTTTKVIEEVTEEDVNPEKKKKILNNKKEKEKKQNERAKDFYCSKVKDLKKCDV